jgi:hypothetical protein
MPTYSCHIPESETGPIDEALRDSGSKEGPWIREAITQRLRAEGRLPGTPVYNVRELAAQAADVIGADRVITMLTALAGEKLRSEGANKEAS